MASFIRLVALRVYSLNSSLQTAGSLSPQACFQVHLLERPSHELDFIIHLCTNCENSPCSRSSIVKVTSFVRGWRTKGLPRQGCSQKR
jgi:hypothetical protein